jgi:hypothetical protein
MWRFRWFSFIFKKYEKNKTNNMLSLMLDPRFKSLSLVSSLIGKEQVASIVEEYDQRSLFPMLLRCYHILHLMAKFRLVANMQTNEKNSLDILEMSPRLNEPTKEVVNEELLMFRRFQVDVKDIKCPLEWWAKHESLFPIVPFCTH